MLLKRTLVLAGEKPCGSVNFIRFGNSMGAKLTLNTPFQGVVGLSVDNERRFYPVSKNKEELKWDVPFTSDSRLGGALFGADGKPFAWGGRRELSVWERAYRDWKAEQERVNQAQAAVATEEAPIVETEPIAEAEQQPDLQAESIEDTAEEAAGEAPAEAAVSREDGDQQVAENTESEMPVAEEPEGEMDETEVLPPAEEPETSFVAENPEELPVAEAEPAPIVEDAPQKGDNRGIPFELPLSDDFYASVRSRLEETLTINPTEADLERLIPESRWVKVFYDGDDYYVIGEVRENGEPRLVGYGVPGVEDVEPPAEVRDVTDFLPINGRFGYWLLFQSAANGEILPNDE